MEPRQVRILVVDDDPRDYELLRSQLALVRDMNVGVDRAGSFDEGLAAVCQPSHDVYLIDYRLGPHDGIDLVRSAKRSGCRAPLIVLTGYGNPQVDREALQAGADDYLVKDRVDATTLSRSIRYALERRRLLDELEVARQRQQQERELRLLDQLTLPGGMAITAQALGLAPIKESLPEAFGGLARRFQGVLDLALEERVFRTEAKSREQLRSMAEQIGLLRGTPGDVIDVYRAAINEKVRGLPVPKAQALLEEGRTMALGLMGYLASYYRSHCFRSPPRQEPRPAAGVDVPAGVDRRNEDRSVTQEEPR